SLTVRTATQAQIARVTSSWDPAGNKTDRQDWQGQTATPWQTFDFGRDSLYRLASVTGMQGGAALPAMDYALDPAGNRDTVTQGTLTTDYAFLTTDNAAVNQYGRRAIPAAQMVEDLYWDAAGNLAAVEQFIGGQMGHVENWTYNWRHQPVAFHRWAGTSGLPAAQVTFTKAEKTRQEHALDVYRRLVIDPIEAGLRGEKPRMVLQLSCNSMANTNQETLGPPQ
ncbi:MAG: hypothetical protein PWP23_1320, partial [Candidatus Sumerlaeota bacterium]|nr:hypothetical protein [Candidatus Sumerlaeota bacterium]